MMARRFWESPERLLLKSTGLPVVLAELVVAVVGTMIASPLAREHGRKISNEPSKLRIGSRLSWLSWLRKKVRIKR